MKDRTMRFEAVIFDLFHTLVLLQDAPEPSTPEILGCDPLDWHRAVFEEGSHHALGTIRDPFESLRRIVAVVDRQIPEEKIREAVAMRARRFRSALMRVRPEILQGLTRLHRGRLRLGLVSNAAYDEISSWADSPLAPFFDAVLFSCHEKLVKPDPALYRRAAERLGVAAERCLYVGDGGNDEHSGARQAGMATILFLGLLEEALPAIAAARRRDTDWTVGSFADLMVLIEQLSLE
jgi:putative hydrolase of the HAD superfamily